MKIVRVALAVPLPHLFDYLAPDDMLLPPGGRVWVPFGSQKRLAIVVELAAQSAMSAEKLKTVLEPLDEQSLFAPIYWDWLHWAANYYQAAIGEVLFQALPVTVKNWRRKSAHFGALMRRAKKRLRKVN